jgi:hypothetical protein
MVSLIQFLKTVFQFVKILSYLIIEFCNTVIENYFHFVVFKNKKPKELGPVLLLTFRIGDQKTHGKVVVILCKFKCFSISSIVCILILILYCAKILHTVTSFFSTFDHYYVQE